MDNICLQSKDLAFQRLIISLIYENYVKVSRCGRIEGIQFLFFPGLSQIGNNWITGRGPTSMCRGTDTYGPQG